MKECRVEPVCSPFFVQSFNCLSGCVFFTAKNTEFIERYTMQKQRRTFVRLYPKLINKKQYLVFAENSKFCGAGKDLLYLQLNIGPVLI